MTDSTPARLVKCPTCRKQTKYSPGNPYRPFCSERCKVIDIGAWADGNYAIPVAKTHPSTNPDMAPEEKTEIENAVHVIPKTAAETAAELAAELGINPADIANEDEDYD